MQHIRKQISSESGQALVEYALILTVVTVLSIALLALLGVDARDLLETIQGQF